MSASMARARAQVCVLSCVWHAHPPVFGGFESPAVPLLGSQRVGLACELMAQYGLSIIFFWQPKKRTAALPVVDR